ncbi:probable disease resistance RPP8-like protein 4 [Mercurialis annua]|uniref:probable disease resistance RPP8-like protein 4 n=1 Tax=Mercurialis annua TaxID=3986 RepID=UPI00215E142B|nr:probable disease resistance RPP8-like protein 4 [Mercurialis annua]
MESNTYDAKIVGKEFCEASGFPKLETLRFSSKHLVEWAEIVNGAFPSLRYLEFHNCENMRFVNEDLRNISTLQELKLQVHGDLARQLLGEENYKIKQIPKWGLNEYGKQRVCKVEVDESNPESIDFKNLEIRSLFLDAKYNHSDCDRGLSVAFMQDICKLQFLVVLRIFGVVQSIPDEVGNLVNLKFLGLAVCVNLDKLPRTLGNLQKLQTLGLKYWGRLRELPVDVLKLQQLRHLQLGDINDLGVRVPKGIGTLVNLQTCEGVCAGYGIANELGTLTQLRRFGANCVSEGHSSELAAAIMNMQNLLSLTLEAEGVLIDGEYRGVLPQLENFSPPHLVQELTLCGALIEIPSWVISMQKLTSLNLYKSYLSQDDASILQYLPKIKYLYLWEAYNAKIIGEEFCEAGGFPELETLRFSSEHLVEWGEIVNGAFPSLRYLEFHNCENMRFVTEDLRNLSMLQEVNFRAVHEDLARQLRGEEKYKIKGMPKVMINGSYISW